MFPAFTEDPFTTPQARRSFLRHSISEETWTSRSGASILKELSSLGVGIRKTDFLAIRREKLSEIKRKEEFSLLPSDQLIPYSMMNDSHGVTLTNTAQYRLRLTVEDPETGKQSYVYRSIGDDKHYEPGVIEEFAESLFQMGGRGYNYNIVETVLHEVWIRPGGHLTA